VETLTLKNGAVEAGSLVAVTMMSLERVLATDPMAFYDLVMVCRDKNYQPFGNARERLDQLGLWKAHESHPHDSTQNIVLSAVSGDGIDMMLGSPI